MAVQKQGEGEEEEEAVLSHGEQAERQMMSGYRGGLCHGQLLHICRCCFLFNPLP